MAVYGSDITVVNEENEINVSWDKRAASRWVVETLKVGRRGARVMLTGKIFIVPSRTPGVTHAFIISVSLSTHDCVWHFGSINFRYSGITICLGKLWCSQVWGMTLMADNGRTDREDDLTWFSFHCILMKSVQLFRRNNLSVNKLLSRSHVALLFWFTVHECSLLCNFVFHNNHIHIPHIIHQNKLYAASQAHTCEHSTKTARGLPYVVLGPLRRHRV